MKTQQKRKLRIVSETLRVLSAPSMRQVAGGTLIVSKSDTVTLTDRPTVERQTDITTISG